jgi:uncharacterized membrane protein YfcA
MSQAKLALFVALGVFAVVFVGYWVASARTLAARLLEALIGFVTNFFDTLGIGSFATTTSIYKLFRMVPDEHIPGTLNIGHALPTVVQAFIFIAAVQVAMPTLIAMILASVLGAWLGAGVVAGLPRRAIQIGMGAALLVAAMLFAASNLNLMPGGGEAMSLDGWRFWAGIAGNFVLGALMTLGIGLYAPCMILVYLLGMHPLAAFPIMMGSCAFLMPVGSLRFIAKRSYEEYPALGLALGGVPAVLIAALIVKSLPVRTLRWGVVVVVLYTAGAMLYSALREGRAKADATRP